ncbi:C40 family peptidase [Gephyromycinifex aptenodytis]|uniref:C40 family peptidase n=1 Tax=Gephyromycinifex aptenodytis TaxID=2716227 RepID=UPI001444F9D8|nr:C40 family peptidase [Gephyromycinifex aptenodytis]
MPLRRLEAPLQPTTTRPAKRLSIHAAFAVRVPAGALAGALLLSGALSAHADPAPTPAPSGSSSVASDSSIPTEAEVRRAKRAVAEAAREMQETQAQLDQARIHLEEVHEQAALAAETSNKAKALLAKRTAAAAAARSEAVAAAAEAERAGLAVEHLATEVYMQGGSLGGLELLLGLHRGNIARQAADMDASMDYRTDAAERANLAAKRARSTRRTAAQAELQQKAAAAAAAKALSEAKEAAASAEAQATAIEQNQAALVTRLAALRRTSVNVEQQRQDGLAAAAIAAEEARVQAEQAQRAQAARAALAADKGAAAPSGPLPAPRREAAATAIAFAKAQLGEPYLWAAEGPDRWDCSGLTMGAWKAAGRSLPHYSGWQYQQTARVAIADLQPGDLVFFGKGESSIHHVGLYVGNGQMIEAPRTGLNVRYSSIYRSSLLPYGGRP